jgi:hypothetical protein
MSDSHTDKIDSQRSDELRSSMVASGAVELDDSGNISTTGWSRVDTRESTPLPNQFRQGEQTTVPKGGLSDIAAQQIAAYLPDGCYRILSGTILFDSVSPSELARLICVGAVDHDDKLMLDYGPWRRISRHPALDEAREMFGSDLEAALS